MHTDMLSHGPRVMLAEAMQESNAASAQLAWQVRVNELMAPHALSTGPLLTLTETQSMTGAYRAGMPAEDFVARVLRRRHPVATHPAERARLDKETHPDRCCPHCLWLIVQRDGSSLPCQNHPVTAAPTPAASQYRYIDDMSIGDRLENERQNFAAIKRAATVAIVREERAKKEHGALGPIQPTPQSADVVHGDASPAIRAADVRSPARTPRPRTTAATDEHISKYHWPELFCPVKNCLSRVMTKDGTRSPCPTHPLVQLVPGESRMASFDDVTDRTEVIVVRPITEYRATAAMRLQDVEADAREMIAGESFPYRDAMLMHVGRMWTLANERAPSESECAMLNAAVIGLWPDYARAAGIDVRMISRQHYELVEKAKAAKVTPEQLARVPVREVRRTLAALVPESTPGSAVPLEQGRRRT